MKKYLFILLIMSLLFSCRLNRTFIELTPKDRLLVTGKGLGKDAVFNPFADKKNIATVKNLGVREIKILILENDTLVINKMLNPNEKSEFHLEPRRELYIESSTTGKASIQFKKL